jgi:hypothetical protein
MIMVAQKKSHGLFGVVVKLHDISCAFKCAHIFLHQKRFIINKKNSHVSISSCTFNGKFNRKVTFPLVLTN